MAEAPNIDWSAFNDVPEQTLSCRCGATYRSHAKALYGGPQQGIHARKPCPHCGQTDSIYKASTDPETMNLKGG